MVETRTSTNNIQEPALMHEGLLEDLIGQGRIPEYGDAIADHVLVTLPPVGATQGDDREYCCDGEIEFFAPNGGPSRGFAKRYEVSLEEATRLKTRQAQVLEEIGTLIA